MFPSFRPFAKRLLVITLVAIALLSPSLVRAEPSFHKIKKRLHRVEHVSGIVLCQTGEVIVVGVVCGMLDALITRDDDDACQEALPVRKVYMPSPAKPANPPQHHLTTPSKPAHPTK